MSDTNKVPAQTDSGNVSGPGSSASRRPAIGHRKVYSWGLVAGAVVLALMLWGFFGMDHEKPVIQPVMEPAAAASTLQ